MQRIIRRFNQMNEDMPTNYIPNRPDKPSFYYSLKGDVILNKKAMSRKIRRSGIQKTDKVKNVVAEGMYDPNSRAF